MTQADRLEQGRNRHFPAAVNAEEQDVFRIKLEIQPRPAVRNNPCGEQKLTGAMGFPAVVLEKHPRRAVQLRHDHALRSVDDKRSGRRHERNFAHINFLFLHLFDRVRHFSIKDHQPDLRTQRRRKSQSALLALFNVKSGFSECVTYKLKSSIAAVAYDREDRGKRRLQPLALACCRRTIGLQERSKGFKLGCQQERNVKHIGTLGETLADTFFLGVGVVHGRSELRKQNPLANSGKHTAVPVRNGQTKTKAILRKCLSRRNTFHQCPKRLLLSFVHYH